jgi:hypothetical protein
MFILLYIIGHKIELLKYFCYNMPEARRGYYRHRRLLMFSGLDMIIVFFAVTAGVMYLKLPNQPQGNRNNLDQQ